MKLIFCLLILIPNFSVAENAVLKIKPYNRVFGEKKITLLKLTDETVVSPAQAKQLNSIVMGDAPKIGEQRIYSDKAIAGAIRQSPIRNSWHLQIPHQVVVENLGYQIDKETVSNELLARWMALCSDCQMRIKSLQMPALPAYVAKSPWELENDHKLPHGSFSQKLTVTAKDSGRTRVFWINGQMEIRKRVPVLTRSTPMSTRLTEDDFRFEWKDVTYATDTTPTEKEIIGQKAKFTMNANDIIWRNSLVREKAVQRGEIVKISMGEDNWQISLQAKTEQDGFIGDTINLRNLETNRIITGRVVGNGEVEVR